jgi:hypothetical protein
LKFADASANFKKILNLHTNIIEDENKWYMHNCATCVVTFLPTIEEIEKKIEDKMTDK